MDFWKCIKSKTNDGKALRRTNREWRIICTLNALKSVKEFKPVSNSSTLETRVGSASAIAG